MCEICSKLTIKTPERRRRRFGVFIVNFKQIVNFANFEQANANWEKQLQFNSSLNIL